MQNVHPILCIRTAAFRRSFNELFYRNFCIFREFAYSPPGWRNPVFWGNQFMISKDCTTLHKSGSLHKFLYISIEHIEWKHYFDKCWYIGGYRGVAGRRRNPPEPLKGMRLRKPADFFLFLWNISKNSSKKPNSSLFIKKHQYKIKDFNLTLFFRCSRAI